MEAPMRRMANSSPPYRYPESTLFRIEWLTISPIFFKTLSPSKWPYRSLYRLKLVEIEHQQGERGLLTPQAGQLRFQGLEEMAVVVESRQIIGDGEALDLLLQSFLLSQGSVFFERLVNDMDEMIIFEGLLHKVGGPFFQGLDGVIHGCKGSEHDDARKGMDLFDPPQGLVSIDSRETDIHQDDFRMFLFDLLHPFFPRGGSEDFEPFELEEPADDLQGIGLIVNDQDFSLEGDSRERRIFHRCPPYRWEG